MDGTERLGPPLPKGRSFPVRPNFPRPAISGILPIPLARDQSGAFDPRLEASVGKPFSRSLSVTRRVGAIVGRRIDRKWTFLACPIAPSIDEAFRCWPSPAPKGCVSGYSRRNRSSSVTPVLSHGSPESVGMSVRRVRAVADLGRQWVDREGIQAVVLLAARRGTVVLHEAFGRLTPDANAPPLPKDAIFSLVSISKVIAATALMTLVEEGRVGLNRPVSSYIPEFQGEGKEGVLVRHLLTHTSGMLEDQVEAYAQENAGRITIPSSPETLHPLMNEWLHLRYGCPLWKPPGEEMSYCEFGFELVGEIIRRNSGMTLDRFVHSRIFRPLGMNSAFFCRADAPKERRAQRPRRPDYAPDAFDIAIESERISLASGTAVSDAPDLAIFGQMFLNGGAYGPARILGPASVRAMIRNQIPGVASKFFNESFPEASWGLGWSIHGTKTGSCGGLYSAESFEHWGGGGGCYLWVDPLYDLVGVYYAATPPLTAHTNRSDWAKTWRNDLFTDAVTAAVEDP